MHDEDEDPRRVGRDEMNLCEFPIATADRRSAGGVKTLVFEDRHGTLTVIGSDAYGLPTAPDSDVIVGLIQLTKLRNDFTDPTVEFTRYELLKLLGWPDQTPVLPPADESLHRWVGVTLRYDGCWWDNDASAGSTPASTSSTSGPVRGRGRPGRPIVLHLGQEVLQELPGRQPQAARPRHLLRAEERHQQAALSVPRQAVLPPARLDLRPPRAGLRARRDEPELRAEEDQGEAATRPRGAGGDRLPRADDGRRPLLQDRAGRVEHPPGPEAAAAGRGEAGRDEAARARADRPGAGAGRPGRDAGPWPPTWSATSPRIGSGARSRSWTGSGRRSRSGSRTSAPTSPRPSGRTSRPPAGFESRAERAEAEATARARQEQQEQARQAKAREREAEARIQAYWEGLDPRRAASGSRPRRWPVPLPPTARRTRRRRGPPAGCSWSACATPSSGAGSACPRWTDPRGPSRNRPGCPSTASPGPGRGFPRRGHGGPPGGPQRRPEQGADTTRKTGPAGRSGPSPRGPRVYTRIFHPPFGRPSADYT